MNTETRPVGEVRFRPELLVSTHSKQHAPGCRALRAACSALCLPCRDTSACAQPEGCQSPEQVQLSMSSRSVRTEAFPWAPDSREAAGHLASEHSKCCWVTRGGNPKFYTWVQLGMHPSGCAGRHLWWAAQVCTQFPAVWAVPAWCVGRPRTAARPAHMRLHPAQVSAPGCRRQPPRLPGGLLVLCSKVTLTSHMYRRSRVSLLKLLGQGHTESRESVQGSCTPVGRPQSSPTASVGSRGGRPAASSPLPRRLAPCGRGHLQPPQGLQQRARKAAEGQPAPNLLWTPRAKQAVCSPRRAASRRRTKGWSLTRVPAGETPRVLSSGGWSSHTSAVG